MMNKDGGVKNHMKASVTEKNNGGGFLKSASDHIRSSPLSFRASPRIVTPLSIFKRRSKAFKSKVSDSSDTEGDQKSVVSSLHTGDDESVRSSIRSFRLGIRRGNYSPKDEVVSPPLMPKTEAVLMPPPVTKRLAAVDSNSQGVDLNPAFRPRLDEESMLELATPALSSRDSSNKPRKARTPTSSPSKATSTYIPRVVSPTPPRTRHQSPTKLKQSPARAEPISPPRSGRRYSCPTSMTNTITSKKSKKKPNYDSDNAQPGSGIRLSKPVKIFLLLLQPKSKIFELIRIACHPQGTTVNGVLSMIPLSATEHALGLQEYIGLCRPTDGGDVSNSEGYVQITRGEILVAIPKGYTGTTIAPIGMKILSNPKIVKLLKRSEQSSRRKRSYRDSVKRVETVPENEELNGDESTVHSASSEMKIVLKKAAQLAAAANADVVERLRGPATPKKRNTSSSSSRKSENPDRQYERRISWSSNVDENGSLGSSRHSLTRTISDDYSVEDSFSSSWSKSLDYSFAAPSTITAGSTLSMQSSTLRRRHRRTRNLSYTKNAVVATLSMMILWYVSDPHGRSSFVDETTANPMGLIGLIQTVMVFWSIYKVQRWVRRSRMMTESRDRCPFLRASSDVYQHVQPHRSTSRSLSGFP